MTEVVAAVAFDIPPGLTSAHIAGWWSQELVEDFPTVTERGPYDAPVETFGDPSAGRVSLNFNIGVSPPSPRYWFQSDDGTDLIQVQPDWFACNWRKVGPDAKYSNWAARRGFFERYLTQFLGYLDTIGVDQLRPRQCEVTYINHIQRNGVWATHADVGKVFSDVAPNPSDVGRLEEWKYVAKYYFNDEGVEGRLHVAVEPVYQVQTDEPAFALNLTARGAPLENSIEGIMGFLDAGRSWIVRTFDLITTDEMHRAWGKNATT